MYQLYILYSTFTSIILYRVRVEPCICLRIVRSMSDVFERQKYPILKTCKFECQLLFVVETFASNITRNSAVEICCSRIRLYTTQKDYVAILWLYGPRTICCTHYFHSLLLHHNITTSDIVPTLCSYLNT